MQQDTPDSPRTGSGHPLEGVRIGRMTTRGQTIAARMHRLGISQVELAKLAGIDRGALRRAVDDSPSTTTRTVSKIETALGKLEHEFGLDEEDSSQRVTSTITLPTGERITFSGDPAGVAEAATRFLAERRAPGGGGV